MIEYEDYNQQSSQSSTQDGKSDDITSEMKESSYGFTSSAQERMWMDQVRRECVKGYTNRI